MPWYRINEVNPMPLIEQGIEPSKQGWVPYEADSVAEAVANYAEEAWNHDGVRIEELWIADTGGEINRVTIQIDWDPSFWFGHATLVRAATGFPVDGDLQDVDGKPVEPPTEQGGDLSFDAPVVEPCHFSVVAVYGPDFVPFDPPSFGKNDEDRLPWMTASFEGFNPIGDLNQERVGAVAEMKMGGQKFDVAILSVEIASDYEVAFDKAYMAGTVQVTYWIMMIGGMENLDKATSAHNHLLEFTWPKCEGQHIWHETRKGCVVCGAQEKPA